MEMFIDFECSANYLPSESIEAFLYNVDKTQNNKKSQEQSKETRQTKREEGIKRKLPSWKHTLFILIEHAIHLS